MAVASACPDVSVLQQLALGNMPPAEVEHLARHCEQCPRCIQVLHSIKAEDTLIGAMAAQGTAPDQSRDAVVNALIERLKRLPSPVSTEGEMTATVALGPTRSVDVPPAAAIEQTLAGDISLAPAQSPDEIGRLGGYRVLKILGAGGMGMVYHAEDVHLQRPIALKVMKPEVSKNPTARERFLREARAAAKLKSDHVVNIYQVGEERQVVFLAMEFLEGMSLDDWLKKGRKPTVAQAARMGRQIALGLADAHACGLIHRDIKPGNIWLDSRHQGRVKLLDFGLARGDKDEHQLTQSGAIVGTPAYMAPEQARGEHVDPRGDLFSLGVVLYRLTTGQLPFRGDNTMSVLTSLALDTPKPPREIDADIPPRLASLIEHLLSKDREQRPKTAKAVADELAIIEREATQATADERTVQVAACGLASRAKPQAARRRLWLAAASLLLLLGGVAAAIVVIIRDKQGNKIAEINAPRGSKIEIQDDGKDKDERKAPPVAPKEAAPIAAALAPLRPGEPLSPAALVRQPAKLPGVRSWSIEKRDSWMTTVVAYRPDGKRLAVGDTDGRVRIWEPQSGRLVQMAFDAQPVSLLAWSPDGKLLAVGVSINAGQSAIQLWDAQAGRTLWRVETPWGGGLSALAWSADGRTLLATVTNVGCLTWNPADGKLLRRVAILCGLAAFSPDAKRLAGGTGDNRVALWDVETGKEIRKLDEHKPASLPSLAWSPDGKRLALTAADSVYVWQAETGERIGHYKDLTQCCFACWSPNGSRFAVSRYRINQSAVVDVVEVGVEGEPRRLEDDGLASLAWSPDGNTIARIAWGGGGGGGWVRLYDAATGKRLRTVSEDGSHVPLTALSRDGQTIAVWENGRTTVASVDTGSVRAVIEDTQPPLALSPDGQRVVTGGPNHALILWESGGKVRIQLAGHEQEPAWASWSPDGKRIASKAHEEKRILLWDAASGERLGQLGPFVLPPNPYRPGLWSPDGRLLAFVPVTGMGWHFWDVEQNKLVNDPKKWNEEYLALSPDGHSALTWKHLSSGQLQEIVSGKKHGELATVIDWGAAYSPDGRQLAVQVSSGCQLWRGDLRRRVRNLERPRLVGGGQLTFSADGKVVLGISGRRLHVWETDTGRLHGVLYFSERWNNLTIAANGHYNGNELVERGIVMVVQKDDGTQELLEPADFEQKYGWKNDPNKVHLLQPLPPPLYPLPGQPMGPNALVREPAPLPEVNSWTVETLSARHLIRAVAYRTDSKRLATGGEDGTIRIWDTSTGELVRMLSAETWVHHLSWSRDGRILAANCADAVIRLWDADTGGWRLRIPGYAMSFFWSPDGRTIAVTDPSKVCFHDLATGKLLRSFNLPGYCGPFAWSPDGKRLAFAVQGEKALRVINTESGKEIHRLEGHAGPIYCVAWSPDGKQMASGGRNDAGFRLWDMVAGKLIKQVPVEKVWENTTQTLAWSPDGRTVALGFVQGPHGLYDVATGRLLHSPFAGQSATAVAISPDGKQAVMADAYGVRVHNASTSKLAHVLEKLNTQDGVRSLAWSPDNRRLAVGIGEGVLLDAATGKRELSLPEAWRSAVWSADGKMIATAGAAGGIRLWDAATYRRVCELEGKDPPASLLAWSPDGKRLAAGDNRRIWVWSSPTGKLLWKNDKFGVAFSLVWSPDGRWLAATDNSDKTQAVRIFHGDTGELYMESPLTWETQAAWSPDGKTLAAGPTEQGECLLIDAESGKIRVKASAKGGRHHIRAIRWAADGSTFSTMDRGDFQRTFDAATGKQLRTRPIALPLGEYRWSPDGRILACSTLYKVHLYDENFWPLGILLPGEPFARLAVAADGHYQGNARVERQIRILVQRSDGTTETLTPHEFEQKYNFKNDPAKVRLIEK